MVRKQGHPNDASQLCCHGEWESSFCLIWAPILDPWRNHVRSIDTPIFSKYNWNVQQLKLCRLLEIENGGLGRCPILTWKAKFLQPTPKSRHFTDYSPVSNSLIFSLTIFFYHFLWFTPTAYPSFSTLGLVVGDCWLVRYSSPYLGKQHQRALFGAVVVQPGISLDGCQLPLFGSVCTLYAQED